jgi:hypothetical protein
MMSPKRLDLLFRWSFVLGLALPLSRLAAQGQAAAAARPPDQTTAIGAAARTLTERNTAVTAARVALHLASFAEPRNDAEITAKVAALKAAEIALANARADYLAGVAAAAGHLSRDQIGTLVQEGLHGGAPVTGLEGIRLGRFKLPAPLDFDDHAGFTQIFDGATLRQWDGDPAIWHVADGAIVGVSTKEKPVRNSYISYHGTAARDFDLKLELKVLGPGGSGIQYRSAVNVPWRQKLNPGQPPRNLAWMMTGPQADFWPIRPYSGQFYSENTELGIVAWRGQVVNSIPGQAARQVGRIGNLAEMETYVRTNDWNQYEIIARGGTMMHVINGQLMAVEVDDDPASSNNPSGLIGIEIEGTPCRVFARNIWLRKIR